MKVRRGRGPYFAQVPWELQDDPRADAATIATYAALQRYADFGQATGCRVSDAVAAEKAGLSRRAFIDRRARLRELGWVSWESGKAEGGVNIYVVHRSLGGGMQEVQTPPVQDAQTPSAPDAHPPVQEVHTTENPTTESPTKGPREARDTWLTDYLDQHKAIVKGKPNPGVMARHLRPLHEEHGAELVLAHQRVYLTYMVQQGDAQYISYAKFAETFGQWSRPPVKLARGARPTAAMAGKDYLR